VRRATLASLVDTAVVGVSKLCIGLLVWATGFSAISDDDFSRVVIAQRFAAAPALDPSGTSWLPLPFWLNGTVMLVAGRSLGTARGVALVVGIAAALLVYAAARLMCEHRRDAYLGALVAAVVPTAAVLGVATVPELPTAALCVFAVATATRREARYRLLGAGALWAACLSRYEPWLIALAFSALTLWDGWRGRLEPTARARRLGAIAAAVALCAPLGWILHNAIAHGHALQFMARVTTFQRSLDAGADAAWSGPVAALAAYPIELVRQEPELSLVALVLLAIRLGLARRRGQSMGAAVSPGARRVAVLVGAMVVGLSAAALAGGAPTHHIGRPLTAVWLLAALFVGAELSRHGRERSRQELSLGLAAGALLVVLAALGVRPWLSSSERFAERADEVALGRAVARLVPSDATVLLQVVDYGYFAVLAASGRPESIVVDRSVDPRLAPQGSSFASPEALRRRLVESGSSFLAADRMVTLAPWGAPLWEGGRWGLWRVNPARGRRPAR
jgi:hypothetical protein